MTLNPGAVFGDFQVILNLRSMYDYVAENDPNDNLDGEIVFLGVPIVYVQNLLELYPETKAHLQELSLLKREMMLHYMQKNECLKESWYGKDAIREETKKPEVKFADMKAQPSVFMTEEDALYQEKLDLVNFLTRLGDEQLENNANYVRDFKMETEISLGEHTFKLNPGLVMTEFMREEGAESTN